MDGWPSLTGRPAVARQTHPSSTNAKMSRWHAPAGAERAQPYLVESERARETPSFPDRPRGDERRRAGDGASAHRQLAGDLSRTVARTHAGEAVHRKRGDTATAVLDRPSALAWALAFVAEHQGEVVAYGSCNNQRTGPIYVRGFTGEVSELYVLRKAQRQGAGSLLMAAMARALLERGHRGFALWVLEQNAPARRFYERLGGTLIGERHSGPDEVAYGWSGPVL